MENEALKLKLEKFIAAKIPIHIVLKKKLETDLPRFLNGLLISKKTDDIFVIDERKLGKTYVFLEDIYDVSVFIKNNRVLADEMIEENDIHLGEGVMKEDIDLIKNIKEEK
jgi:hypothetical protein